MSACTPTDRVPAYLRLNDAVVTTDPVDQGAGTHKITCEWVYANDQLLGVWDAQAAIPVLDQGNIGLRMVAGIPRNGVVDDRIQYPFYQPFIGSAALLPENSTGVTPTFTYYDDLVFFVDRFEPGGFTVEVLSESDTSIVLETDPLLVKEGTGCGKVVLDTAHNLLRFANFESIDVSAGPVFMELDYRCDHRFLVGAYYTISGTVQQTPYLFVAPTKRADGGMPWNKIYVDLSQLLNLAGTTEKKFYVECYLEPGETNALFYFDNVKLIHR